MVNHLIIFFSQIKYVRFANSKKSQDLLLYTLCDEQSLQGPSNTFLHLFAWYRYRRTPFSANRVDHSITARGMLWHRSSFQRIDASTAQQMAKPKFQLQTQWVHDLSPDRQGSTRDPKGLRNSMQGITPSAMPVVWTTCYDWTDLGFQFAWSVPRGDIWPASSSHTWLSRNSIEKTDVRWRSKNKGNMAAPWTFSSKQHKHSRQTVHQLSKSRCTVCKT